MVYYRTIGDFTVVLILSLDKREEILCLKKL